MLPSVRQKKECTKTSTNTQNWGHPATLPFLNMEEEEDSTTTTTTIHGRKIRRKKLPSLPKTTSPIETTYRLLCTYSTSGAVIGTSGSIVKLIQQETGAKIWADTQQRPRSNERIFTITGPQSPLKKMSLNEQEQQEAHVSAAQHGLIRVLERVWEVEAEDEEKLLPAGAEKKLFTCRLLADKDHIGFLMGKGGKKIAQLGSDFKVRIRVFANVHPSTSSTHEVVQIEGVRLAVKRATLAVSECLQDVPPREQKQMLGSKTFTLPPDCPLSDSYTKSPPQQSSLPHRGSSSVASASKSYLVPGKEEVVFRLLCSNDRIGGVIGNRGLVVKTLENETGASIRAVVCVAESEDRVIHISAMEDPRSQYSPAQNAVICVFKRSIAVGNRKMLVSRASKDPVVEARLLISLEQAGFLSGVGGTVIPEIRKITRTSMWILRDDEVPPCAAEKDAVLKIEGSAHNVQHALFIITGKLRNTIFCNKMVNTAGRTAQPITADSYPPLHCSLKPGQRSSVTEGMHRLGLSRTMGHSTSPEPRRSKTTQGENSRGVIDTGRGAADPRGGLEYGSGRKSAVVTSTTLEIVFPEYVLGCDESILNRAKQISGAKVSVHDHLPGSNETTLIISGTPDQTQAAQSVLQALILGSDDS